MKQVSIGEVCTQIEKGFNFAGSLPIVSIFSSAIRMIAGKVQAIAGIVLAGIGALAFAFTENKKWEKVMDLGAEFIIHGCLNAVRGAWEAVLALGTFGIGNAVFFFMPNIIMLAGKKPQAFAPIVKYGTISTEMNAKRFAI